MGACLRMFKAVVIVSVCVAVYKGLSSQGEELTLVLYDHSVIQRWVKDYDTSAVKGQFALPSCRSILP